MSPIDAKYAVVCCRGFVSGMKNQICPMQSLDYMRQDPDIRT